MFAEERCTSLAIRRHQETLMKKIYVSIVVLAFVSVLTIRVHSKVQAAPSQSVAEEGKGCAAPKEWGQLKGVADRSVAFEDASGSIRVLDLGPCMRGQTQLIVKINRP
jgi:hypothetical protein